VAVQLNDAKITVKLDLEEGEKAVESLEKRTVKQRTEAERDRKKAKSDERKARSQAKARPGIGGRIVGAGLFQIAANLLRSIPILGAIAGAGIAKAELNERFGPFLEEFILGFLRRQGIPVADISTATESAKDYAELKSQIASLTVGLQAATERASADLIAGGLVSAEEFAEIFTLERRFAEFTRNLQSAEKRARQGLVGGAAGASLSDVLDKVVSGSLNK